MIHTLFLFDLDDTIFDNSHRQHYIADPAAPDWDGFHSYDELIQDRPMSWTAGLWTDGVFKYGPHGFLTARDERSRAGSAWALDAHGFTRGTTRVIHKPQGPEKGVHFKARVLLDQLYTNPDLRIVFSEDLAHIIRALRTLEHPRLTVLDVKEPRYLDALEQAACIS